MLYWFRFFFLVKYLNVQSPKHSTFPLEPLYGELTVSPFWANGECTLSQQWAHSEPTVNANEQWMMSKRRAQTQAQRNNERIVNAPWTIGECYVSARWTIYLVCLRSCPYIVLFGVPQELSLHCVLSVIKKK